MKTLGIIGGLGPMASAYLLQLIIEMTDAKTDQEHLDVILFDRPQVPDRTAHILDPAKPSPLPSMRDTAQTLERLGAGVICAPCVTSHCFYPELAASVSVPFLHMVEEAGRELLAAGKKRAGILATTGTVRTRLFQDAFARLGLEAVVPDEEGQGYVMSLIYEDIKAGRPADPAKFQAVSEKLFAQVRQDYHREHPRVGIRLAATMRAGAPLHLAAEDPEGRTLSLEGPVPQTAIRRPTTREEIARQLEKTGGTPYYVQDLEVEADAGLAVPLSTLNGLRRRLLDELSVARIQPPERPEGRMPDLPRTENRAEAPVYTLSLRRAGQLTEALLNLKPAVIYLAPEEILAARPLVERAIADGVEVCAALPRVLWDSERPALERQLDEVRALGVTSALVGELGTLAWALQREFTCRGDFGLGVYNSLTLAQLREMGLRSATLSFEQRLARVRDLAKPLDTELIVYGRLPLMITQNCIIKNRTGRCACENVNVLTDRKGARFPVVKAWGCRNELLNSQKLFLADKSADYRRIGLWAQRLLFTTENPRECVQVAQRYLEQGRWSPNEYTRGLYYRDVE